MCEVSPPVGHIHLLTYQEKENGQATTTPPSWMQIDVSQYQQGSFFHPKQMFQSHCMWQSHSSRACEGVLGIQVNHVRPACRYTRFTRANSSSHHYSSVFVNSITGVGKASSCGLILPSYNFLVEPIVG